MPGKLMVAAAGAGKTTFLVHLALKSTASTLLTTYTETNADQIRAKFFETVGFMPEHVCVQTWFSFLIQHGCRPYQSYLYPGKIEGMHLSSGQSAIYTKASDIRAHYLDSDQRIYSDKISKFLVECNKASNGKVIKRLQRVYPNVYIDEVQDLAGYDLELLKLVIESDIDCVMVGDPRQGTYVTANSPKLKKYRKNRILTFFEDRSVGIVKDESTLNQSYRCNPDVCALASKLFPDLKAIESKGGPRTGHDGIFLVDPSHTLEYLEQYKPMQLRHNQVAKIHSSWPALNFGKSKGLTFDRVLIYPTLPISEWIKNRDTSLAQETRAKLYVAITRARYSVAFVCRLPNGQKVEGFPI